MATSKSKGGGPEIRFDEFIKQIRPQPGSAEQIVLVQGYIGESDKEDQIRIYSDESLSEYIDISRADILYAIADDENPLGGSRLWVKQSANVNYNDAYAQGDMYNDYMQNTYAGTGAFGPGAVTIVNCPGPVLTRPQICVRPSQFICPTPASRLIICTIQKTPLCPVTITRSPLGCGGPSLVDGCPSALGCTIDRTIVINPARGGFAGDYGSGDMYGDYMQNTYDGGAAAADPPSPSLVVCQPASRYFICQTVNVLCRKTVFLCITRDNRISRCNICVTPTLTRTIRIPDTTGGGGQFFDDYGGGDLYGDYMQNTYDGGAGTEAFGPTTNAQVVCAQQISLQVICQSVINICPTRQVWCRLTRNNIRTICRPCYEITPTITRTPQSIACGGPIGGNPIGGGGQFFDDYSGGDLYGDYMQNTYDGGASDTAAAGVTTTAICLQPVSAAYICPTRIVYLCGVTRPINCWLTRDGRRTICRPCYEITPTITRTPQSLACNPGIPGGPIGGGGGQFFDDYSGGDLYGDYMQNTYDGGVSDAAAAAVTTTALCAVTRPQVCIIATSPIICRRTIQATIAICCRITFSPALCRTRAPQFCITQPTVCCVTRPPVCPYPSLVCAGGGNEYGGYGY